ncbi:MAG: ABC transporter permease [Roseiflexaceae bacterium]|nr:ABC transporter permease [Roseiflexaceae bacterium]
MARLVFPATLATQLLKQRGRLRAYQWLWLLLCVAGTLVAAAPRILLRPLLFDTAAVVQADPARSYTRLITTPPDAPEYPQVRGEFDAVAKIALSLLQVDEQNGQALYPRLGNPTTSPTFTIVFEPRLDGQVIARATAQEPVLARQLADDGAVAFARSLRAAGGREIFRLLQGWGRYAVSQGAGPRDPFQAAVRQIWVLDAFPLNAPVDLRDQPLTVDMLSAEDQNDLARAMEVREQELLKIDLPALKARRNGATGAGRAQLDTQVRRYEDGLAAIRSALTILYDRYGANFDADTRSAVFRSQLAAPAQQRDRQIPLLLGLTTLVGLLFGGLGVAVDRSAGVMPKLRELYTYRELVRNLVLRDLRVRYKGSVLGYLWTQLAPLLLMLVFLFVFSTLQKQSIALFPVFLIVGLLPWNFCAEAVTGGSRSVIDNANLIKKVYFPREILPLVSVFSALVNFLLSLPMMFVVMAVAQWLYPPLRALGGLNFSWTFAYLPVLIVIQTIFLAGVVFFTSALSVAFRDFVHLIGILIQFWFFLTPVVYALDNQVSGTQAQLWRWLNPMASLIEFYHGILYGGVAYTPEIPVTGLPALDSVLRVLVTSIGVLAVGYWFFQRRSRTFGESI